MVPFSIEARYHILVVEIDTAAVTLGRAWGWGVLKGNRICSWEAIQPIPMHDLYSLVHKYFADLGLASALERE